MLRRSRASRTRLPIARRKSPSSGLAFRRVSDAAGRAAAAFTRRLVVGWIWQYIAQTFRVKQFSSVYRVNRVKPARFTRLSGKPAATPSSYTATHGFSIDVVEMNDIAGPHHRHPNGEIDLVMPLEGDARFDGHGAGWVVYGPGSAHRPTVSGGKALVLYLLPDGAIEFAKT